MTYKNFFDFIFGLADLLCESTETEEYAFFLLCVHKIVADENNMMKTPFIKSFSFKSEEDKINYETKESMAKQFNINLNQLEIKNKIVTPLNLTVNIINQSSQKKGVSFKTSPRAGSKKKRITKVPKTTKESDGVVSLLSLKQKHTFEDEKERLSLSNKSFVKDSNQTNMASSETEQMVNLTDPSADSKNVNNLQETEGKSHDIKDNQSISDLKENGQGLLKNLIRRNSENNNSDIILKERKHQPSRRSSESNKSHDMRYFHEMNDVEHRSRIRAAKPKYMEKAMLIKNPEPVTLEKVILHQMRHSHSTVSGDYPRSYVHLSGFIEMGIVNTDDIYGQKPMYSMNK